MEGVLIDLRKMSDPYSGLGQFSLALAEALHRRNNKLNLFFLIPDKGVPPFKDGFFLTRAACSSHLNQFGLVHHLHQESDLFFPGKKNLLTVHDINFIYKYRFFKRTFKRLMFERYLRKFDPIVSISYFTRSELSRHFSTDFESIPVVYNGLIPLHPPATPFVIPSAPFFFSIGAFLRKKNLHTLIPMMNFLPSYQWIVAGPDQGAYAEELKKEVRKHGLSERIIFTGPLSDEHKAWYFQHCEALFFPSISEGFGLPVLEAFSAGKPVFCFPLTALPEVSGGYAYSWNSSLPPEMAEFVERSLSADSFSMAEQREHYAMQFSWEKAADAYLDLYESMLS